jgi:hypothetical protein
MKRFLITATAAGLVLFSARDASAQHYVLTFDNGGAGQPADFSALASNFGSVAGVVSVNNLIRAEGASDALIGGAVNGALFFRYADGTVGAFNDEVHAPGASYDHMVGEFNFMALAAGSTVTLNSFGVVNDDNTANPVQYAFYDAFDTFLGGGIASLTGNTGILCPSPTFPCGTTVNVGLTSSANGTIRLLFSSNSNTNENLGHALIDNLDFTVNGAGTLQAVTPEPATMMLMATGLVGMSGAARMRRRKKS